LPAVGAADTVPMIPCKGDQTDATVIQLIKALRSSIQNAALFHSQDARNAALLLHASDIFCRMVTAEAGVFCQAGIGDHVKDLSICPVPWDTDLSAPGFPKKICCIYIACEELRRRARSLQPRDINAQTVPVKPGIFFFQ